MNACLRFFYLPVLVLGLVAEGRCIEVRVVQSGAPEIDSIVIKLISGRPSPLPSGGILGSEEWLRLLKRERHATAEVEQAIHSLIQLGPKAFPFLQKHLDDDRYSYSTILPSAHVGGGWTNVNVGDAVATILRGDRKVDVYKIRQGADGKSYSPPNFWEYVETEGGIEQWAKAVANSSELRVTSDFFSWCIQVERERGFLSIGEEERLLGELRGRVQKNCD